MRVIAVDYYRGGGGNAFSRFLNGHLGVSDIDQYEYVVSYIAHNYYLYGKLRLRDFTELCEQKNLDCIAIPFHFYQAPEFVGLFEKELNVRFVKINQGKYIRIPNLNFVQKVYFREVHDKQDTLNRIAHLDEEVQNQILDILDSGNLLGIDLTLALADKEITSANKRDYIERALTGKKQINLPTNDITVEYEDFFVRENLSEYHKLCDSLNIKANDTLYKEFVASNYQHYLNLLDYDARLEDLIEEKI